jgi:hypothetical protein
MQKRINFSLDDECLEGAKKAFDEVMDQTLITMQTKGSMAAKFNLQVDLVFKIIEVPTVGADGKNYLRKATIPKLDYKITSMTQAKEVVKGSFGGGYEMVYDDEAGEFVMQGVDNGQTSMFDRKNPPKDVGSSDEDDDDEEDTEGFEPLCLTSGSSEDGSGDDPGDVPPEGDPSDPVDGVDPEHPDWPVPLKEGEPGYMPPIESHDLTPEEVAENFADEVPVDIPDEIPDQVPDEDPPEDSGEVPADGEPVVIRKPRRARKK